MKKIVEFFTPTESFGHDEWILKNQISTLLVLSFFLSIGVSLFSIYRYTTGSHFVGVSQGFFALFLMCGFFLLRSRKRLYPLYSLLFFILFFIYIHIVFFFVPQNSLNILWIVTAPIFIFFFLNKRGGIVIFILLLGFYFYLLLIDYNYTAAEYITLAAVLTTITFIMFMYDSLKDAETERLQRYNEILKAEVLQHTKEIALLNENLEQKVEEEIEKQLTQEQMLLRKSRMASMGEMIDSIAHQWRQPLMGINTILLVMVRSLNEKNDPIYLQNKIMDIFKLTAHMSTTIDDFRNLLKDGKEKEHFKIRDTIESVLKLMESNLKHIDTECNCPKDIEVYSYKSEFIQVLITLFANSIEALKKSSVENRKITITVEPAGSEIKITIEDSAGGIKEDSISKVFDPYFTTKQQDGGTGLGLYIAKIIIQSSMHGQITAENGHYGAKFTITLPVTQNRQST